MTSAVTVVGSGASGVHFALSLLRKGVRVTMLDVGHEAPPAVAPTATLQELKQTLPDPAGYFLGARFEGALLPSTDGEYYGIPPGKNYVFESVPGFRQTSTGFAPLFSFARGGLGQAWTGGCYPFNAEEVADFPFAYDRLAPHYAEVARRIGITGHADDLARFMPLHDHLLPPLRLDAHSERLVRAYGRARARLNRHGVYLGRTRVATLSQRLGEREGCSYLGRCLWGCPHGALYTPAQTLRDCLAHEHFTYVPGVDVDHFTLDSGHRVRSVVARVLHADGALQEFPVDQLALAAGALLTTKIFLTSVWRATGQRVRLRGLMDNRQVLVPFVNLSMIGQPFAPDSYQYHLLGLGIESGAPRDYVHAQITTLKTALLHPIIQRLPLDLGTSTLIMRAIHAALGLVNLNFRDTRREENYVELSDGPEPRLRVHYTPDTSEPARVETAMRQVKRALWSLNCVVPPGMAHMRPMGASVHYAGTLPMTLDAAPFTATPDGRSRDFGNLWLVDGATFPFLPAKNITFTLMANAVRIAEDAF